MDLKTASKKSNGYTDHFEAVSGFENGVSEMQEYSDHFEAVSGFANGDSLVCI